MKEILIQSKFYLNVTATYKRYERYLLPGMLFLGLVVDFITFRTIEIRTTLLLLGFYLALSVLAITYQNLYTAKKISDRFRVFRWLHLISPLVLQFTYGALLSASLIFYWFSGSFSVSWPVFLILGVLVIFNERFRDFYLRPSMQIALLFFVLFSYNSILFPFLFNSLSPWVFLAGGITSLLLISFYIQFLARFVDAISYLSRTLHISIVSIFLGINLFYFTNLLPPIPLSIRDAGVYHSIERRGDGYLVSTENNSLIERLIPGQLIQKAPNETIYVYNSIFAPTDLETRIYHQWYYYDEMQKVWIQRDLLSYYLVGGRQDGSRGYTHKTSLQEGKWRVDVQTERGQILGRIVFWIELVDEIPDLEYIGK